VVFAAALAIGAAVTPHEDLLEALFGVSEKLSLPGFFLGSGAAGLVIFLVLRLKNQLVLSVFSPELAAVTGVKVSRLDLYFLFLFSLTVLVGLRFMGALLGSALLIVPAATPHQLTGKMSQFMAVSCFVSVLSVSAGWSLNALVLRARHQVRRLSSFPLFCSG
jgi:zinc transport system permease protein